MLLPSMITRGAWSVVHKFLDDGHSLEALGPNSEREATEFGEWVGNTGDSEFDILCVLVHR